MDRPSALDLRALVPVDVRSGPAGALGNRVSLLAAETPWRARARERRQRAASR